MPPESPTVGRLAPSPTGGLHLGHARTFFLAWLAARSAGGRVILRIEDIDASRVRPEALGDAAEVLGWLGLDWDEGPDRPRPLGPYLQSERKPLYDAALERLKADERVYPCTCTRADIARAASAPHSGDEGPSYPGTCSGRSVGDARALGDRPYSWRFRVPSGRVDWWDLIRGPSWADPRESGGDFVVGRSSGEPAYQLAVVCDDAAMGVNQVIRGEDLVTSTPRQILLYRAFRREPPTFGHVPLVFGADGRKLAKRDDSIKLATLRELGADPMRLVGVLAESLGMAGEAVPSRPADWLARFDWQRIARTRWEVSEAVVRGLVGERSGG